jgi:glycosyltransferase involved in cell wall biosynthesis
VNRRGRSRWDDAVNSIILKVTVIIPAYRDTGRLNACLSALSRQTIPHGDFEVIVVNNDLKEDVLINAEHDFRLTVIREEIPGSYAARNSGIRHAKGEILAFTDSDAVPDAGWIENGMAYFPSAGGERYLLQAKCS